MHSKKKYDSISIQIKIQIKIHFMNDQHDILSAFDIIEEIQQPIASNLEENATQTSQKSNNVSQTKKTKNSFVWYILFFVKYCLTAATIFAVLLVASNYSAYAHLVYNIIYAEEMEQTQQSLINSVAAANISHQTESLEEDSAHAETTSDSPARSIHSLGNLIATANAQDTELSIEITPYENRIIIPKIGKNIPLVDIKQQKVSGTDELEEIFMEELENGVIRYPGSAKPGEDGNSFIFGHSSNFPWMKWDYNSVFALLDNLEDEDEVIVYYGQEKYTYKISRKEVIRPGDVSILRSNANNRSQLTLMTCWPIGTTLNRLILIWELIDNT